MKKYNCLQLRMVTSYSYKKNITDNQNNDVSIMLLLLYDKNERKMKIEKYKYFRRKRSNELSVLSRTKSKRII